MGDKREWLCEKPESIDQPLFAKQTDKPTTSRDEESSVRDQVWRRTLLSLLSFFPLPVGALVLAGACATAANHPNWLWIQIGTTTRDEVVQRYGQPDLVIASPEGETATYRPTMSKLPSPPIEIPTMQPGGRFGQMTTKMQPVNPGVGAGATNAGTQERPTQEIRIRYDARGIVQELMAPSEP
jgi:hypothetical protein